MKVAILHSELAKDAGKDELDVLEQIKLVREALNKMGAASCTVPISLDIDQALDALKKSKADVVFNLVESLNGIGKFVFMAPAFLDHLQIPYTGGHTEAMFITTGKVLSKQMLKSFNLPTPAWQTDYDILHNGLQLDPPCIIKPVWEDASVGLDDDSVLDKKDNVNRFIKEKIKRFGDCFAEEYIHGREFNLSILGGQGGTVQLMPAAEIVFTDYPPGKPHIVGYQAKWHEDSFEYCNTVRNFDFPDSDKALLQKMAELAEQCWNIFNLRGYARVDFRIDSDNNPWILEINANPCIAPDSGFIAASQRAGLDNQTVIKRIITDALDNY